MRSVHPNEAGTGLCAGLTAHDPRQAGRGGQSLACGPPESAGSSSLASFSSQVIALCRSPTVQEMQAVGPVNLVCNGCPISASELVS